MIIMDITEALAIAANTMFLGMVSIFVFLGLLVVAIKVLHLIAGNEEIPAHIDTPQPTKSIDDNVMAAISAAVHHYRQTKSND